jgi:hypothetical protein
MSPAMNDGRRKMDNYDRALDQYFADHKNAEGFAMQPSNDSHEVDIDGKAYVVFVNVYGVLAWYEFDGNGAPVEVEIDDDRRRPGGALYRYEIEEELVDAA